LRNLYKLTRKEKEIIELFLQGYTYDDSAEKLVVTYSTVMAHIDHICDKYCITGGNRIARIILNYLGYINGNYKEDI